MKSFLLSLILLATLSVLGILGLHYAYGDAAIHPLVWQMLLMFNCITLLLSGAFKLLQTLDVRTRAASMMALIGIKMLACIAFVLIHAYTGIEHKLVFIFNLFALYFLYTFFVVISFLRTLRAETKTTKTGIQ